MQTQRLLDRVAIVTGAARGNGEGIARAMAREGARVVLFDILDAVHGTAQEISSRGQRTLSFQVDVTDSGQVNQAVQQVLKQLGKVDILVNNAGVSTAMAFLEATDEFRDSMMALNFSGAWNCTKAVIPSMIQQRYGRIINISSVTGPIVAGKGNTVYAASKSAISGFTKALALEMAEFGVTVNAICPDRIDTPGVRKKRERMGIDPDEWVRKLSKTIPLGRMGSIDDIGSLAVFLASDESEFITGTQIVIDGGDNLQEEKGRWQDME